MDNSYAEATVATLKTVAADTKRDAIALAFSNPVESAALSLVAWKATRELDRRGVFSWNR